VYTEEGFAIHKADSAFSGLLFTRNLSTGGIFLGRWPALGEGGAGDGRGGGHALIGESLVAVGSAGLASPVPPCVPRHASPSLCPLCPSPISDIRFSAYKARGGVLIVRP